MSKLIKAHHERFAPSSMPMLAACPHFVRADEGDRTKEDEGYLTAGTEQHDVFAQAIHDRAAYDEAPEHIQWAVDQVAMDVPDLKLVDVEQRLTLMDDDFNEVTFGTADGVYQNRMWDLKSGEIDVNFRWQFMTYALMQMQRTGFPEIEFTALFTRQKKKLTWMMQRGVTESQIIGLIREVKASRAGEPFGYAKVNEYCGWCRWLLVCPAAQARVEAVRAGREDWTLAAYHASEITNPEEMAKAKRLSKFLKEWCAAVDHHALKMSETQEIPGFRRSEYSGKREVIDIEKAFVLSGFESKEFLPLCEIPIGAFEEAWAAKFSISKDAAKKQINLKLAEAIATRPSSFRLIESKKK